MVKNPRNFFFIINYNVFFFFFFFFFKNRVLLVAKIWNNYPLKASLRNFQFHKNIQTHLKQAVEWEIDGSILKKPFVWDNGFKFLSLTAISLVVFTLYLELIFHFYIFKFQWFLCSTGNFTALERFLYHLHWNFLPCFILFWIIKRFGIWENVSFTPINFLLELCCN